MSINYNFKKDKCWSCEFFCGKRQYKKGLLLGESVDTDSNGVCSNKKSNNCNGKIWEDSWCSKYQKWGVLQSAIAKKESERVQILEQTAARKTSEESRKIQESNARQVQAQREILNENKRVLEELKYQNWYAALTPDEKEIENARILKEKQDKEERRKKAVLSQKKRKKVIAIIISAIVLAIIILVSLIAGINAIRKAKEEKIFNESFTGQIVNYIRTKSEGSDTYSFSTTIEEIAITFTLRYSDEGFSEGFGKNAWIDGGKYKFMAYASVAARNGYSYSNSYGGVIFNWDALKDMKGLFLIGQVHYGENTVFNHYQVYNKGICPKITYNQVWHSYAKWDNSLDIEESRQVGWYACEVAIQFLNTISKEELNSNLW